MKATLARPRVPGRPLSGGFELAPASREDVAFGMPAAPSLHMAFPRFRWVAPPAIDPAVLGSLVSELRLPEPVCTLLARRGHDRAESAKRFLRPRPVQMHAPAGMAGMEEAVERLTRAVRAGERILVHGDYDVDGVCSTALLVRGLASLGARPVPFVPHRLRDGYDLTDAGVEAARRAGATLILTADCGIVAHAAVARAAAAGIDVIVTDHHTPGATLPTALAVVNPNRADCGYPYRGLAGAGVAYKLLGALAAALGAPESRITPLLDLVALATVADLAPLADENRVLVRWGLSILGRSPNPGIRALLRASGLGDRDEVTAGQVGYVLAPRLNAAGRLGDAMRGVRLLLTHDEAEAEALAAELEAENRRRREIDEETLAEALGMLERGYDPASDFGVVLASDRWHPGVIGIVASRVVERIHRPTVLIALAGGEGRGSARSIPGFHLHEAFVACAPHLARFGGHRAAAGCSLRADAVGAFRQAFNTVARERLDEERLQPALHIDARLELRDADRGLLGFLAHFAPFGIGNPAPVFAVHGVRLAVPPRVVGGGHLKLTLSDGAARLDAIGFGMGDRLEECASGALDVAFKLEENRWRDGSGRMRETVQARVVDFRPAA